MDTKLKKLLLVLAFLFGAGGTWAQNQPFPAASSPPYTFVVAPGYYTSFANAKAQCPAAGCIIDMTSSGNQALGTIDVGNNGPALTLLLGPYNYTATQIVLRTGTKVYGMGGLGGLATGTNITATSTTNPLIVANTNPSTDQPAQHVTMNGIQFFGAANGVNTADGMLFQTTSTTGLGGIWYSIFENIQFQKFGGVSIHFQGPSTYGQNGDNQWVTFINTTVFRTQGGGNALRIEGSNNFIKFINGELDGYAGNGAIDPTSTPNIFIGGGPGSANAGSPYMIMFEDVAIQGSAVGVQIDGGYSIKFLHCHHEEMYGVFHITQSQMARTSRLSAWISTVNHSTGTWQSIAVMDTSCNLIQALPQRT